MNTSHRIVGTPHHWLVGQRLDTKSNLCPKSVKSLSNVCQKTGKVQGLSSQVQGLSNGCQKSVEFLFNQIGLGQSLDMEIQGLSRQYQMEICQRGSFSISAWTNIGQGSDSRLE